MVLKGVDLVSSVDFMWFATSCVLLIGLLVSCTLVMVIFSVQSSPLSIQEYRYEFVKLCVDFHVVLKMMFPRFYFKNPIFGNYRVNRVSITLCRDY